MKIISFFVLLAVLALVVPGAVLFGQDAEYEPYTEDEFPDWALDARRFEVIMIGAIPVTMLVSILGYNVYQSVSDYIEDPTSFALGDVFSASSWEDGDPEKLLDGDREKVLVIGLSLSAVIATMDYILGRRKSSE